MKVFAGRAEQHDGASPLVPQSVDPLRLGSHAQQQTVLLVFRLWKSSLNRYESGILCEAPTRRDARDTSEVHHCQPS